jgi:hypothetical protein
MQKQKKRFVDVFQRALKRQGTRQSLMDPYERISDSVSLYVRRWLKSYRSGLNNYALKRLTNFPNQEWNENFTRHLTKFTEGKLLWLRSYARETSCWSTVHPS